MFNQLKLVFPSKQSLQSTKLIQRILPLWKRPNKDGQDVLQLTVKHYSCLRRRCDDIPLTCRGTTIQSERYITSSSPEAKPLWSTVDNLADLLLDNIILENEHLVAINKSSGLSMHVKRDGSAIEESLGVTDALPQMCQRLDVKHLEPALGINRKYSGIILLAKSKEMFQKLRKYYTSSVPAQKIPAYVFWGLTVRIPEPQQGADKLTITKKNMGEHTLTYIVDEDKIRKRGLDRGEYLRPFIQYEVLERTNSTKCALVEFKPTTSKWDVLPLFIVKKLATLLGDHVYSSRLATILGKPVFQDQYTAIPETQILPKLLLGSLQITKDDVKDIPLHLHLRSLTIPKLSRGGKSIEIETPLPDFFIDSMNRLGFSDHYSKWTPKPSQFVEGLVLEVDNAKDSSMRSDTCR